MSKAHEIPKFSNSLTEFLINALTDKYGDAKHYSYRYNNLKVYMDPSRTFLPHFYVSIGISEACFDIESGNKSSGSLGFEDNYVSRWAGRTNIYNELKLHWKAIKEAIAAEAESDVSKKSTAIVKLKHIAEENDRLNVDMTGTGIDKSKRYRNQKLLAFKKRSNIIVQSKKKRTMRRMVHENT